MGAAVSSTFLEGLVGANPPQVVEWAVLRTPTLHSFLTSDQVLKHPSVLSLSSSVCKHTMETRLLPTVYRKILEAEDLSLTANLLLMLKIFFSVVFSERIPYNFLFQTEGMKKREESAADFPFRKQVTCSFTFQGQVKTLQMSIPQNQGFDRRAEYGRFTQELTHSFDALRDYLRVQKDTIVLFSASNEPMDLDAIIHHFDQPDSPKNAHRTLHLTVKTTECTPHAGELGGEMAQFLTSLVHWYVTLPPPQSSIQVLKVKHAIATLLVTTLSSQLAYVRKQTSNPIYTDFKVSPAVDILCQLQPKAASEFVCALLQDLVSGYKWLPTVAEGSYFEKITKALWSSDDQSSLDSIRNETGNAAMSLSLLLLSYANALPSPFPSADLSSVAVSVYMKLIGRLDDPQALLLLFLLLRDNRQFRDFFTTSSEHDQYLPRLCNFLYHVKLTVELQAKVTIVLGILVVLSQDDAFIRFLNKEVKLGNVAWLPEYRTNGISLGSLLYFVALRVFKDNVAAGNAYVHALVVALLFNLSPNSVELHEITAQSITSTIVSIWRRVAKPVSNGELSASVSQLLDLFLDVFAHLLRSTYKHNPWLVYMTLHESEAFAQMAARQVNPGVTAVTSHLIAHFLPRLDSDNILSCVTETVKVYTLPGDVSLAQLATVKKFEVSGDQLAWEAWTVPLVWGQAREQALVRLKTESVLLNLPPFS